MSLLKQIWNGWQGIAVHIGNFQSRLLLTAFYFTILMPIGIVIGLFGDTLGVKAMAQTTGWQTFQTRLEDIESARRNF